MYIVQCIMHRSPNKHLSPLKDIRSETKFDANVLDQIVKAKSSLFNEICREIHVERHDEIKYVFLNKRSVSKELLCSWLEGVCSLLTGFCVPQLQEALKRCEEQQDKIIEAQETIIELQAKVIENRDEELACLKSAVKEELKTVQTTVQTEIKSYSAAVSKSCSVALSEKKIQAAVKSVTDKEDRNRNLILYGVEETAGEDLPNKASSILEEIEEKPLLEDCCRVGMKNRESPRPVKLSLRSSDMVQNVLRKARLLRGKEGYKTVYICPDRTVDERRAYKKLVEELKAKKSEEPDKFFVIRNGKVVSLPKDSRSAKGADT